MKIRVCHDLTITVTIFKTQVSHTHLTYELLQSHVHILCSTMAPKRKPTGIKLSDKKRKELVETFLE